MAVDTEHRPVITELPSLQFWIYVICDWIFTLTLLVTLVVALVGMAGALVEYSLPILLDQFTLSVVVVLGITGMIEAALYRKASE